jgi:hypothetical protein
LFRQTIGCVLVTSCIPSKNRPKIYSQICIIIMKISFLWAFILPLFLVSTFQSTAQRNCGAVDHMHAEEQADPHISLVRQQIEAHTQAYINNTDEGSRVDGIITIPVVVHVIYNNATENISDAQIQTQIDVLNDDFRRLNSDADGTWSQSADTEIEFCMATIDPNGAVTNGITRTSSSTTAFGTNDQMKFNSSGGKDAWPAGSYLNMWSCDISGGILGYAQFPGGADATDGVVMDYQYFGTIGTATAPFDLGRTATHEVGHWLNLRHIWGDGNCNVDDFVSDTPNSDGANYGCASTHVSCSTTDMVQNYMDYSDDACMNLFTQGQKTRMRALFDAGGAKVSLLSSGACGAGAPPSCTDNIQNGNETGVDCGGNCVACPTCSDGSQNGTETGVDCGGADCTACPCNGTSVTLSITLDNYPEETSWSLTDANGSTVAQGGTYGDIADGTTLTGDFCLADGCYDFTINDAYGDGMCCSYGNGSYSINDGSTTLVSGATFTTSETTNFCVSGGTTGPTCTDGTQNGTETGVDCGGSCPACETCIDGIQNQGETGVDCGGPCTACPTCDAPTGLAASPSDIEASLSWNAASSATTYNIRAREIGSATWVTGNGLPSPVSFTGLTACSDYEFQVQSGCSTEISAWSSSSNFTTTGCSTSSCNDGLQNGNETGIDCGGECPACPTCTDGVLNGNETGIDCGGSCDPCSTACSYTNIDTEDFESNYGIWNDGGSDCSRPSYAAVASSGVRVVRLRDNSNSSILTTDNLNLSAYEEITIDFHYVCRSMENIEDFFLQVSTNGGGSYTTVEEWSNNDEFINWTTSNNAKYNESVVIPGPFTSTTRIRFRADASGNSDWVYLDDISISGCLNASKVNNPVSELVWRGEDAVPTANLSIGNLFPNPASDVVNVKYAVDVDSDVQFTITDLTGRVVYNNNVTVPAGKQTQAIDVSRLGGGYYLLILQTGNERVVNKFVTLK